ncbi:Uncharacterised protein [Legionella steigerwaltii]|uniref:Mannosyltransferase n=1 Tax=Legionella steigerwaltii TaxID=460 RepID=A0A378L800_9GAMM|nr:hypothetical protein [Legionella steigerwaltii]KTD77316.1 hypothetical protein Lstg_1673 [Legionella steigerwaltii]STY22042.1 Uncharacterised protein [Legionella steigerwaltii]
MNKDFLCYKSRFITFALLLGYAFLHYTLTRPYTEATFDQLINFSERFPYAQRVLIPLLVYPLSFLPIQYGNWFFLVECLFSGLMYVGVYKLLRFEFNEQESQLLSWLFILLLPLTTIINYRFTVGGVATFFYPADTPSIFFIALGLLWCLKARWLYFVPLVFLATLNRESSILLVSLIPLLHWQKLKEILKPLLFSLLAYISARIIVISTLGKIPGPLVEWTIYNSNTHFEINLEWLFVDFNLLLFCFCFSGLPLFWFAFYDYIPKIYRPIRYLVAFYFIGLLLVGNFFEARIFAEIIVLLYLPVCVALRNWLSGSDPLKVDKKSENFLYFLNRYSILIIFALIIIFHAPLDQALRWCLQHLMHVRTLSAGAT